MITLQVHLEETRLRTLKARLVRSNAESASEGEESAAELAEVVLRVALECIEIDPKTHEAYLPDQAFVGRLFEELKPDTPHDY